MSAADAGGGGGRILIDPQGLRRSAQGLRGVAAELSSISGQIGCPVLPEMPPGLAGSVQSELAGLGFRLNDAQNELTSSADELVHRAFWTEVADELIAGQPLSAAQLRQFKQWALDGSLLRWAEPWQAELAGTFVGRTYARTFHDPKQLLELVRILRASEGAGENFTYFSTGFVDAFGAKNMVEVPRVIQAMEYARLFSAPGGWDTNPFIPRDVVAKVMDTDPQQRNWLDLLAPFSQALAVATYGGMLSRKTEEDIASNPDTWAMSQLLYQGRFGTDFLKDCFQHGVVDRIVQEARDRQAFAGGALASGEPLNAMLGDGNQLPLDPKVLVLDAIARNGDAAAQILQAPIDVQVMNQFAQETHVTDPVRLLFDWAHYDDKGAALGHAMQAGVGTLLNSDPAAGNDLTERWINETINAPHDRVANVDHAVSSLGAVIAGHYVGDLHDSAYVDDTQAADLDHDGIPGSSSADGIRLSSAQTLNLLGKLWDDPTAREQVAGGIAAYQADLVAASAHPGAADYGWAEKIGNFDALLQSATDENRLHDVVAVRAQRDLVFKGVSAVASLVPMAKAGSVALSQAIAAAQHSFAGPSVQGALDNNYEFEQAMRNNMDSVIVGGYYENGGLGSAQDIAQQVSQMHGPGMVTEQFLNGEHLIPYSSMSIDQQDTFNTWKGEPPVHSIVSPAIQAAHQAYDDRVKWAQALSQ